MVTVTVTIGNKPARLAGHKPMQYNQNTRHHIVIHHALIQWERVTCLFLIHHTYVVVINWSSSISTQYCFGLSYIYLYHMSLTLTPHMSTLQPKISHGKIVFAQSGQSPLKFFLFLYACNSSINKYLNYILHLLESHMYT